MLVRRIAGVGISNFLILGSEIISILIISEAYPNNVAANSITVLAIINVIYYLFEGRLSEFYFFLSSKNNSDKFDALTETLNINIVLSFFWIIASLIIIDFSDTMHWIMFIFVAQKILIMPVYRAYSRINDLHFSIIIVAMIIALGRVTSVMYMQIEFIILLVLPILYLLNFAYKNIEYWSPGISMRRNYKQLTKYSLLNIILLPYRELDVVVSSIFLSFEELIKYRLFKYWLFALDFLNTIFLQNTIASTARHKGDVNFLRKESKNFFYIYIVFLAIVFALYFVNNLYLNIVDSFVFDDLILFYSFLLFAIINWSNRFVANIMVLGDTLKISVYYTLSSIVYFLFIFIYFDIENILYLGQFIYLLIPTILAINEKNIRTNA